MTSKPSIASMGSDVLMLRAYRARLVIPSFNIPYLPMMKAVVEAVREENAVAFIAVARLEWIKFQSGSLEAIREEYEKHKDLEFVRLHLDHTPVIDEDDLAVDYVPIIERALRLGYDSVMVDGSRLAFEDNVAATRRAADLAHAAGRPIEAELGAVYGHEDGPRLSYEEIFAQKRGFTDTEEAERFVARSACDWLSVAAGSIHGAISVALRDAKKANARLDLEHTRRLAETTKIPLVLHGGTGVEASCVQGAARLGVTKINIGTEIRQVYEQAIRESGDIERARSRVRDRTRSVIREMLAVSGSRSTLAASAP